MTKQMQRVSLIVLLLVLLFSLFLLAVLSNLLTGYSELTPLPKDREKQTEKEEEKPSVLLFKVSPPNPQLYWRVSTADYYTGLTWLKTTDEKPIEAFPEFQTTNVTKVFTVEIVTTQREIFLPLPSPNTVPVNVSLTPSEGLRFYEDRIGNVYKVTRLGQAKEARLVYEVAWWEVELDDKLISLDSVPEEIQNKYLQLPDIPIEVWRLAKDLEDPSYSVLDQVLADVQFLRTNFVYDDERLSSIYEDITRGSNVFSYIQRRKGTCIDAATALTIILRIQKIPARISIDINQEK